MLAQQWNITANHEYCVVVISVLTAESYIIFLTNIVFICKYISDGIISSLLMYSTLFIIQNTVLFTT